MKMTSQAQQRHAGRNGFAALGMALTSMLLCSILAGCGSNVLGKGGQSQATPAPTSSPTWIQQSQTCGKIDTNLSGKPVDAAQAKLAGNCFWQAYQHCQAASLLLRVHSLDTGADHLFTLKSTHGTCSIMDAVTHYIVPNNLKTTRTYTCKGLVMQADGLHFIACGSLGNIVAPM